MADTTATSTNPSGAAPAATTADIASVGRIAVAQVSGGIKYRNKDGRVERWKKYDRIAAHNYVGGQGKDSPKVNLMAARTRAVAPMLAFNAPTFNILSKGPLPDPNSEVALAAMLERTWVEEGFQAHIREVLLDWPAHGTGAVYVGFESAGEGDVLDAKKALLDASQNMAKQGIANRAVAGLRKTLGFGDPETPVDPPSAQTALKFFTSNRAFIERISTYDLVLDPCATSAATCDFMARRLHLPLVKAKLMFGADCPAAESIGNVAVYTDTSDADPFGSTSAPQDADKFPDEVKRVEVWEHWSMSARRTTYIDKGGKVIGQPKPWKSPHPGFPIVVLEWDAVADCPWAEGLMAAMHDLNDELNEIRRRELAEIGKAFGIILIPDTLSAEKEAEIRDAKDRAVIRVSEEEADRIIALNLTALPPETWGLEQRVKADLDEISRTSSSMTGTIPSGDHTATEASYAQGATDAAMADRQRQVEEFVEQIAERVLAIFFTCFSESVGVHIPNQDPELPDPDSADGSFIPVGTLIDYPFIGTEHAGFYTVKVSSGSMASSAKDIERQQASMITQLYGKEPWFDLKTWALDHMAMFPSVKDPSRYIVHVEQQTAGMGAGSDGSGTQPTLPPDATGGTIPPTNGAPAPSTDLGVGSGQPQADLLAATMGGGLAPGTGVNGSTGY